MLCQGFRPVMLSVKIALYRIRTIQLRISEFHRLPKEETRRKFFEPKIIITIVETSVIIFNHLQIVTHV